MHIHVRYWYAEFGTKIIISLEIFKNLFINIRFNGIEHEPQLSRYGQGGKHGE
jgi:hypothetical protein